MTTKRLAALFVFVLGPLAATGAGCKVHEAATDACKGSVNGEVCNACCKENGESSYVFVSGDGCTCRG